MKGRESGMPEEDQWSRFFDADEAMSRMLDGGLVKGDAAEFGCGYGTFTIPASLRTQGTMHAFDIETQMVELTRQKAARMGIRNIDAQIRDFVAAGTGLADASHAHAMIYNLLHIEQPFRLLNEARRILRAGGSLSVMHWKSDVPTPRGPPLGIRPSPEQCAKWMRDAGFERIEVVDLGPSCPWHFALLGQ